MVEERKLFYKRRAEMEEMNKLDSFTRADKYYGRCKKDGRHSPQENPVGFMTAEQAIEAWNRRAK